MPDLRPDATAVKSAADLAAQNRAYVLRQLLENGPLARADLARLAGVPRGTIGNIVQILLDDGVLEEQPPSAPPPRGKPSRPLWFTPLSGLSAGVQVSARHVDAVLAVARGTVLSSAQAPIVDSNNVDSIVEAIAAAVGGLRSPGRRPSEGIGVAIPGLCEPASGVVIACTPIPVLAGVDLAARIEAATGISTSLIDDTRALALGERWFGVGRHTSTFAAVQIGEGIGAGIVLDGRTVPPPGVMSESGHTRVVVDGELCPCGKRGCWETIASRRWLGSRLATVGLDSAAILDPSPGSPAHAVLADYARNVAIGLSNLALVLGIRTFVLYGDAVALAPNFAALVEAEIGAHMAPATSAVVHVLVNDPADLPPALGAAASIVESRFGLTPS